MRQKEIVFAEREKEIKSNAQKTFDKINIHKESNGMRIKVSKVGTENEISFLTGGEPAKTELKGWLVIPYNGELYEVEVHGFHNVDEAMCAAILVLADALLVPVEDIFNEYSECSTSKDKVPLSLTDHQSCLSKILDEVIRKQHNEKLEKITSKNKKRV